MRAGPPPRFNILSEHEFRANRQIGPVYVLYIPKVRPIQPTKCFISTPLVRILLPIQSRPEMAGNVVLAPAYISQDRATDVTRHYHQ